MNDTTIVALVLVATALAWAFIAHTFKERRDQTGVRDKPADDPKGVR